MSESQSQMTPVPLSHEKHKGLKVKQQGSASHIKNSHFAMLYTSEFSRAGLETPIIFLKDPNGQFIAASMWGFEPGENLFVEDDKWVGGYFPSFARCFPFAVLPDPEKEDHFYIGLFEESDYINKEEGELIIDDEGNKTEWMKGVEDFLIQNFQQNQITKQFINKIDSLGLLIEQSLSIKPQSGEEEKQVGGFHVVDKEKLAALPDETILELFKEGGLDVIYAHLMSLESLYKLVRRKDNREINNKQS